MDFVIEIENLNKSFGNNHVLKNLNLKIKTGESYVVIGCSGTGKSVLIKCILGLIPIDSGNIKINGKDIKKLPSKQLSKLLLKCSVLFQGAALFDSMNIIDNISFGLIYGYNMKSNEAYKTAYEKLEAVNLDPKIAKLYPEEISGGMKKRVGLARALATNPNIIFYDEPTTGLDPINSQTINELIVKCTKEMGISSLAITHDMSSLRAISDKVGLLHAGNIVWEGCNTDLDTSENQYIKQFVSGKQVGPLTSIKIN